MKQSKSFRRASAPSWTYYHVPRTRTKLGDRAFSIAGPKAWNNLPQSVRLCWQSR